MYKPKQHVIFMGGIQVPRHGGVPIDFMSVDSKFQAALRGYERTNSFECTSFSIGDCGAEALLAKLDASYAPLLAQTETPLLFVYCGRGYQHGIPLARDEILSYDRLLQTLNNYGPTVAVLACGFSGHRLTDRVPSNIRAIGIAPNEKHQVTETAPGEFASPYLHWVARLLSQGKQIEPATLNIYQSSPAALAVPDHLEVGDKVVTTQDITSGIIQEVQSIRVVGQPLEERLFS